MIRNPLARLFFMPLTFSSVYSPSALAQDFYVFGDIGEAINSRDGFLGNGFGIHSGFGFRSENPPFRLGYGVGIRFKNHFGIALEQNHMAVASVPLWIGATAFPGNPNAAEFIEPHSTAFFANYRFQPKAIGLYVQAQVGIHRWQADIDLSNYFDGPAILENSGTDLTYGVSFGHQWSTNWSTSLNLTRFEMNQSTDERIAARVEYHF